MSSLSRALGSFYFSAIEIDLLMAQYWPQKRLHPNSILYQKRGVILNYSKESTRGFLQVHANFTFISLCVADPLGTTGIYHNLPYFSCRDIPERTTMGTSWSVYSLTTRGEGECLGWRTCCLSFKALLTVSYRKVDLGVVETCDCGIVCSFMHLFE